MHPPRGSAATLGRKDLAAVVKGRIDGYAGCQLTMTGAISRLPHLRDQITPGQLLDLGDLVRTYPGGSSGVGS